MFQYGTVCWTIGEGNVEVLAPPSLAAIPLGELLETGSRICAITIEPDILDTRDFRVRGVGSLDGLTQVKDAADVGTEPLQRRRILSS